MKKRWRIGIITLGSVLITLGILFILPLFTDFNGLMVLQFWPIILIMLGIEIIGYMLFSKEEGQRLQFSGGSIALLIAITIGCMLGSGALVAVDYFGIDRDRFQIRDWVYYIGNDSQIYDTAETTAEFTGKKLTLDLSATELTIKHSEDGKATATIKAYSRRSNVTGAEILKNVKITDRSISVDGENISRGKYVMELSLPDDMEIDLNGAACSMNVADLKAALNLDVSASSVDISRFLGNIALKSTASEVRISELDGNLDTDSTVGSLRVTGITGVMTGDLGAGDYTVEPQYSLKKGWTLNVSEGNFDFTMPENMDGAMEINGVTTSIDTDAFADLIKTNMMDVSFKVPAHKDTAIKLTTRNAHVDLHDMDHVK